MCSIELKPAPTARFKSRKVASLCKSTNEISSWLRFNSPKYKAVLFSTFSNSPLAQPVEVNPFGSFGILNAWIFSSQTGLRFKNVARWTVGVHPPDIANKSASISRISLSVLTTTVFKQPLKSALVSIIFDPRTNSMFAFFIFCSNVFEIFCLTSTIALTFVPVLFILKASSYP